MKDISSVINKVKALLNLANNAAAQNSNEAAAAAANAAYLMDKYRITQEQLDEKDKEKISIHNNKPFISWERQTYWKYKLALILLNHFGCTSFIWKQKSSATASRTTYRYDLIPVGTETDVALAKYLYSWIEFQIQTYCDVEAPSFKYNKTERAAWCVGAVDGVKFQLDKERDTLKQEFAEDKESSSALIKVENRLSEAQKFLNENVKLSSVKTVNSKSLYEKEMREKGFERGKEIDVHGKKNKILGS